MVWVILEEILTANHLTDAHSNAMYRIWMDSTVFIFRLVLDVTSHWEDWIGVDWSSTLFCYTL